MSKVNQPTVDTAMSRVLKGLSGAILVALAFAPLPATAVVSYSVAAGLSTGPTSVSFQFVVTTPEFITTPSQLPPAAGSCAVTSLSVESCSLTGDILFFPRMLGLNPGISFSAVLKPLNGDFSISQNFRASFGVPPGAQVFDTPGLYTATSLVNLTAATLQVSGFADPVPQPIPEPSTWLLLIGGLSLTGAAMRSRRVVLTSAFMFHASTGLETSASKAYLAHATAVRSALPVPEPSSFALTAPGLIAAGFARVRRSRRAGSGRSA